MWSTAGIVLAGYVLVMYAVAFVAQRRIHDAEDFLVAGRRLTLPLASATLMATWFGAGTLLTAADEVRQGGLRTIALEPLGSGCCLLIAGFFFARPLWEMKLLTLPDFFRRRFGGAAETLSALIMVPSYFGWIAVQFIALAGMLELTTGIDLTTGILVVAVVGTGYTCLGGMWSVTLTDLIQLLLMLAGLIVLALSVLGSLGAGSIADGWFRLLEETPQALLTPIPIENVEEVLRWLSLFCVAALGNIPAQDLTQRIFASRSAQTARRACWCAGTGYLLFGMIPVMLGLAAHLLLPADQQQAIVPALGQAFLSPLTFIIFLLTLASAILSTIDSALLAPASILSLNLLERFNRGRLSSNLLTRLCIVFISAASVAVAYLGEDAYSLLEDAYSLPLVGLLVPLTLGIYGRACGQRPALWSMAVGAGVWAVHYSLGWDSFLQPLMTVLGVALPVPLAALGCGWLAYSLSAGRDSGTC
ncbi:MAG TPA: sodium:solute symporter family protein [Acidobacteriota bacterium]|nr:sodium:solute symporter family protein [Acidobacteriota bacterium]